MNEKISPELERTFAALDALLLESDEDINKHPTTPTAAVQPHTEMPACIPESEQTGFPTISGKRLSTSTEEALDLLIQACHELARYGDYGAMRDRICQLQIELNEYGLLAPSFRPKPKKSRPKGKDSAKSFSDADLAIHRDLIVIDCHWLYVRKVKVRVDSGDMLYQPLFRLTRPFDYELAWMFASENWRNDTRVATALHLRKPLQYQLAALRCNDVAQDLERLKVGTRKNGRLLPSPLARVSIALQEWCDNDPRVDSQFAVYEAIYQAYWLLGPTEKTTALAELAGMIHGSLPLNPRTLSSKLEKLLARMGEEYSRTGPSSETFSSKTKS